MWHKRKKERKIKKKRNMDRKEGRKYGITEINK